MTSAAGSRALDERHLDTARNASTEAVRRWPTVNAKNWLAAFLSHAQRDPNVVVVVAIGSAVRPGVDSDDLDLIACCHDASRLQERAPIEVDLRAKDLSDVDEEIEHGGDLLIWAVRFGEPLLDKNHAWEAIVRRWDDRLPLPDPAVARKRAAAAWRHRERMRDVGDEDAFNDLNVSYLSHCARARLAAAGIHPASRPELSGQLRALGEIDLAASLEAALAKR